MTTMSLTPGRSISRYRLIEKIGEGSMGIIWKALDTRLDREVAVKILPADLARDDERRERFEREARAAAAINHPNVLTIHSVEEADELTFLTTELVEGETLGELLERGRPDLARLLELATALADGVRAAHEQGITHRDLNLSNVMVDRAGRLKILDFGLAKVCCEPVVEGLSSDVELTQEGRIMGTVPYMSPEQAQGRNVDHRTDVFSLGSMLYEMATGSRPFQGDSAIDLISSILKDDPPSLHEHDASLPAELDRIVRRCLEKDPERRFASCAELYDELEGLRREVLTGGALGARADTRGERSIAVLPLRNLSGNPDEDYFADGMTEELITDLARLDGLKVISRTSVMQYKDTRKPLPEIARELGVDTILEGSVLRSGDRIRITADLIQAATDTHLWAERYERRLCDVLTLQSEVARDIAEQIQLELSPRSRALLSRARPVDPQAHEAYLRGRFHWNRRTETSLEQGITFFEQAIERDPAYALAHVGLADTYDILGFYGYRRPSEAFPMAEAAALKALEIDPDLAEAHVSLGYVRHYWNWDWAAAEREYQLALRLAPAYSVGHQWYLNLLTALGRFEEALAEGERSLELDPLTPIHTTALGWVHFYQRDYERAIARFSQSLELEPTFVLALQWLGDAYERCGRYAEALAQLEQACVHGGQVPLTRAALAHAHATSGNAAEARRILDELAEVAETRYVPSFLFALIHTGLGENDRAFERLEDAYAERAHWLVFLDVEPRLDGLRSDRRFADLRSRIGLPGPA